MAEKSKDYDRGIRIADRRKELGLTQDELAYRVGIGRQALSAIENGGAFKSDSVLIKDMNQKKLEEGGHWYVGKFEFSPKGSIKLSKKEKNRED